MSDQRELSQWAEVVSSYLPHLSKAQVVGLAMWSFGMVIVRSCGQSTVAAFLAELLGQKENTVRERLRDFYREAEAKAGDQRQELDVTTCFARLLGWVLAWWPADVRQLALALDTSSLGQRFVVLAVSVVYRGCAIPVAWVVLPAGQPGSWRPHWKALLGYLKAVVPADWTVMVLADRGLYADWLFATIVELKWHPCLRINGGGTFRPEGTVHFRPLTSAVPQMGQRWSGQVTCFKTKPLHCTLLACWEEGHAEPWLIVTDLAPNQAEATWYGLRAWIECGFKDTKRGGWQWQQTRISDPARATRFWLAMAVATLWAVSVGGEADANQPVSGFDLLPEAHVARRHPTRRSRPRLLSCFRRGVGVILAALIAGRPLPLGRFLPEPWPALQGVT